LLILPAIGDAAGRYTSPVGGRDQLRTDVASAIREQILSRQVLPGASLRLMQLGEALGVSITPVREALLLLTQDGWVVHEPNRGFRVAPLRRQDVEDGVARRPDPGP
jgi:DNA-binding GntR family transcriptional regulator